MFHMLVQIFGFQAELSGLEDKLDMSRSLLDLVGG